MLFPRYYSNKKEEDEENKIYQEEYTRRLKNSIEKTAPVFFKDFDEKSQNNIIEKIKKNISMKDTVIIMCGFISLVALMITSIVMMLTYTCTNFNCDDPMNIRVKVTSITRQNRVVGIGGATNTKENRCFQHSKYDTFGNNNPINITCYKEAICENSPNLGDIFNIKYRYDIGCSFTRITHNYKLYVLSVAISSLFCLLLFIFIIHAIYSCFVDIPWYVNIYQIKREYLENIL